ANVECASYGLTCCAERTALFAALTSGRRGFTALALVSRAHGGPMPCGACRQVLIEFAPDLLIYVADSARPKAVRRFTLRKLFPLAFELSSRRKK
ncbi:MAG: cytidine deaminase, partial [Verrucomicrobia bacterium]|nr:cytidine deaminase [Verrucomicrobiota bacterium]